MAKQSVGQKAFRALRLLMGLRDSRVTAAMVAHGFTPGDLQDGLQRLGALTGMRMDLRNPVKDQELISSLDEFENTWFPVARATLDARFPQVSQVLFRNLSQYTGVEVVVSVSTFLKRLEQMGKGEGDFGKIGPEARALLAQRGLTQPKVADAAARIEALATFAKQPVTGPSVEEQKAAEDHLWAWYLEWSAIARVAVKDGRLLRGLGFGQRTRSTDAEITDTTPSAASTTSLPSDTPVASLPVAASAPQLDAVN
jgi:hypothetical protein